LALGYLEHGGSSCTLNLGSEVGFSVNEIAKETSEITKSSLKIKEGARRAGDIIISIASSEKAKKTLGWEPKYSNMETIIKTAWDWEQQHIDNKR
jgi:UDP-glucose 4-epimerase